MFSPYADNKTPSLIKFHPVIGVSREIAVY